MKIAVNIIVAVLAFFGNVPMAEPADPNVYVLERSLITQRVDISPSSWFDQRILTTIMCVDGYAWMTQESIDSRGGRTTVPLTHVPLNGVEVPTRCDQFGKPKLEDVQ